MTVVATSDVIGQVENTAIVEFQADSTATVVEFPPAGFTFTKIEVEEANTRRGTARKDTIRTVFSNSNRQLDLEAVEALKTTPNCESYHWISAPRISGYIYYDDGKFYENISNSGQTVAAYRADTIEELVLGVNRIYEKV